ncbi:hypothetical protein LX32DRAFT_683240 [Colletotrichum zoysiae]|uniref:Tat pathway signal sequence n=1 Tax=Colletotrichum zoysiae TaxID=1216348 RepID=A0AAD9HHT2_9PEZI|nr:hypothetical protein LX32DRAFT_683240 [Colletotrichum zoysiae]
MASKEVRFEAVPMDAEDSDSECRTLLDREQLMKTGRSQRVRNWTFLAVNVFVLLLNTGVLLMVTSPKVVDKATKMIAYPRFPHEEWIEDVINFELQTYDDKFRNHGQFRGVTRPELDEAWDSMMLRNFTVRIPKPGWREHSTPTSILTEFQDEDGGIMGTFSFMHNLHCLKTIRQYMLPEDYPRVAAMYRPTPDSPIPTHIDHCIDILRQSELCHADMALMTFEWRENEPNPVNIHHTPHICANTDRIDSFLEKVSVPPFGLTLNPFTGQRPLWDVPNHS